VVYKEQVVDGSDAIAANGDTANLIGFSFRFQFSRASRSERGAAVRLCVPESLCVRRLDLCNLFGRPDDGIASRVRLSMPGLSDRPVAHASR
jgi:hypothetical protein